MAVLRLNDTECAKRFVDVIKKIRAHKNLDHTFEVMIDTGDEAFQFSNQYWTQATKQWAQKKDFVPTKYAGIATDSPL